MIINIYYKSTQADLHGQNKYCQYQGDAVGKYQRLGMDGDSINEPQADPGTEDKVHAERNILYRARFPH